MSTEIINADCLEATKEMEDDSVDLVVASPPYEKARTYGIDFALKGQEWVDWAFARYLECVRISRGLVCWVIQGQTKQFRWSATPALLMADLHRAGVGLRIPPIFHRVGISGSGGPDWWRSDYEFCVCSSKGKLPWSDNTAMGRPMKYGVGGQMSYRNADGRRRNESAGPKAKARWGGGKGYKPPKLANPGNVIRCKVGGGHMGSKLAHENEAPFPESLVEWFVLSFCPPGGLVFDPFCGSGTTGAVAKRHGRNFVGCDIRESQVELTKRRLNEVQLQLTG